MGGSADIKSKTPPNRQNTQVVLEAHSLFKRYKKSKITALKDFNLQLERGEFFGLLGANGAGKTTAISILSNLFPPDGGTISVMGEELRKHNRNINNILGIVPQEIALYENLTAHENLTYFGKLCGLGGDRLKDRVESCLEFAGLTDRAENFVSTFSGGMKRRLNLVTGLLHNPKILFLDEPTVGIDAQSRHLIHKQLTNLNRKGMTILYTTHYMEEAQELCSRIGIIDDGKIVEQGSPEELLNQYGHKNMEELFLHLTGKRLRDS